jgi:hypothetical protein
MKGKIITSPDIWEGGASDGVGLFLAGGISNCPDWQASAADKIAGTLPITVINPRRNNWDMKTDDPESIRQITWEFKHLRLCKHVIFWFPCETVCPITLLELGAHLERPVELTIGCHPKYERRFDVEVQTKLVRPKAKIWDDVDEMVDAFVKSFKG